jgi:ATP-dependent RNA helicase RhlE
MPSYKYSVYKSSNQSRRRGQSGSSRGGSNKRRGEYIDPSRFVRAASPTAAVEYIPVHHFEDFTVNPLLKANLASKGFKVPTPIQDQTIPPALEGKDIIGIANTGTGKTAAFALPVLHALMLDQQARALIIAPTRELAQQINEEFRSIAKGSGLRATLLIGGTNIVPQLRELRGNPQVVILNV